MVTPMQVFLDERTKTASEAEKLDSDAFAAAFIAESSAANRAETPMELAVHLGRIAALLEDV